MNSSSDFCGSVNIGNPRESTIKEFADMVVEVTGSRSKIVYEPLLSDDPTQRKPQIDLSMKELNWEPQVKLREGLEYIIQYFKTVL